MNIYLINLESRKDRLDLMTSQLRDLGLQFRRIEAVLGSNLGQSEINKVHKKGPLGDLSHGDIGCFLSHRKAWQEIYDSGEPYGLILEDDVILGERFVALVTSFSNLKLEFDIAKLDRHGKAKHMVLLGSEKVHAGVGDFRPLLSKHTATGSYIISRNCAARALAASVLFDVSVDHFLFNRNNSRFAKQILVQQLMPAAVKQGLILNDKGNIHEGRKLQRTYDYKYWKRELIRGLYEVSDLPAILLNLILGARFRKIRFDP